MMARSRGVVRPAWAAASHRKLSPFCAARDAGSSPLCATHLSEAGGLPDEKEVQVAQVLGYPRPGDVGQRGHVDGVPLPGLVL